MQKAAELDVEKLMIREVKEGNKDLDMEHNSTPRNEVIYTGKRSEIEDSSAHLNSGNNFQNNGSRKKLLLYLKESNDVTKDQIVLDDVKRLLLGYSGSDDVALEIETESTVVVMDWNPVKVDACEELQNNLNNILGDSGHVSVQSLMF